MRAYRYAIYAVPAPEHPLWPAAARWLGRDVRGTGLPTEAPDGDAVREAARYGFHGTLKAPFRLAEGCTPQDLAAAVEALAVPPLPVALRLADDLGFPALQPMAEVPALSRLAESCTTGLDRFRAPLAPEELARRQKAGLSERQVQLLARWGYPYVLDEFRFHMTIGDRQADPARHRALMAAARTFFAPLLAKPAPLALAIFVEPEKGDFFRLWRLLVSQ